jgi:hypothetical protein
MKKIILSFTVLLVFFLLPLVVLADNRSGGGTNKADDNDGRSAEVNVVTTTDDNKNNSEDSNEQTEVKNSPSSYKYDVENEVETQNRETTEEQGDNDDFSKSPAPRSATGSAHMSEVAKKVEELLTTRTTKGGIGDKVREVAREQTQAQEQIKQQLKLIEDRRGWLKKLIGPNYKAIKNLQQQLEQNQQRIRQLTQLATEITNQEDKTLIQETITALGQQNTELQARIQAEEQTTSLFGWLAQLLTK